MASQWFEFRAWAACFGNHAATGQSTGDIDQSLAVGNPKLNLEDRRSDRSAAVYLGAAQQAAQSHKSDALFSRVKLD